MRRLRKIGMDIETRLAALEARVADLEGQRDVQAPIDFSVLQTLQQRRGAAFERGSVRGAVFFAGALFHGAEQIIWQNEQPLSAVLDAPASALALVLAALGNPHRLAIVQLLLQQPASAQELQAALVVSSPGQLYHHLKELRTAGILDQHQRGTYHLTPQHVVPILALLAASSNIAQTLPPPAEG